MFYNKKVVWCGHNSLFNFSYYIQKDNKNYTVIKKNAVLNSNISFLSFTELSIEI